MDFFLSEGKEFGATSQPAGKPRPVGFIGDDF